MLMVCDLQIDALKTQLGNLKSKADNCKRDIENMLETLDRAIDHLRRTRTSIDRASDELDMHEPIGTDVNAIKRQQEELHVNLHLYKLHFYFWFIELLDVYTETEKKVRLYKIEINYKTCSFNFIDV